MNCPLCDCDACPDELLCYRAPQPSTQFYPCPACGCVGTWRFSTGNQNQKRLEQNEMINRSTIASPGTRKRRGVDFLNVDHLSTEKQPATILAARVEADNFKPGQQLVAVKVLLRSNPYIWNVRTANPNLEVLCDALGDDETAWKGADIFLSLEVDDFDNKKQIRVEVAAAKSKKK